MSPQNRIYVTLSPRMRKALELCAAFDGSTPASYAAVLMSSALETEIEKHPALHERWVQLEREALLGSSWDAIALPGIAKKDEAAPSSDEVKGWVLAGSHPGDYEHGVDKNETYQGKPSGYLRSKAAEAEGFGTLMQMFKAETYLNKRFRLSAMVKAEDVGRWAGLWMRVDGPQNDGPQNRYQAEILSFDNMQNRPITGTVDWLPYEVVLDVPQESVNIAFGILLAGPGQVWINDIKFTEVGDDVPVTAVKSGGKAFLDKPTNLDFQ